MKNIPKKGIKNQHKITIIFFDIARSTIAQRMKAKIVNVIKPITKPQEFKNKVRIYDIDAQPFGGFNQSGYGREAGQEAILDYTRTKTTWINKSDAPMQNPFVMRQWLF